jgi:hypothetical protein
MGLGESSGALRERIAVVGAGGAGWQPASPAEWVARQDQLASGDRWVLDGNYASTLTLRLKRADTIVFLDLPPLLCARRVLRRWALGPLAIRAGSASRPPAKAGPPVPLLRARFPPPPTPRPPSRAGPLVAWPHRGCPALPARRQEVHRSAATGLTHGRVRNETWVAH